MSAPLPSVTAASLIPELSLILCIQAVVAFDVMRWGHLLMVPDTIKDVLYPLALTVYSPAGVSSRTLHNRMLQLIISILHSPAGVRTLHNRMLQPIISIAASAYKVKQAARLLLLMCLKAVGSWPPYQAQTLCIIYGIHSP